MESRLRETIEIATTARAALEADAAERARIEAAQADELHADHAAVLARWVAGDLYTEIARAIKHGRDKVMLTDVKARFGGVVAYSPVPLELAARAINAVEGLHATAPADGQLTVTWDPPGEEIRDGRG